MILMHPHDDLLRVTRAVFPASERKNLYEELGWNVNLKWVTQLWCRTNEMRKMDRSGIIAQIKAAFRQDVWFPKKNIKDIPNAAAMLADAVSIPRIDGSLHSIHIRNEKKIVTSIQLYGLLLRSIEPYFANVSKNGCFH